MLDAFRRFYSSHLTGYALTHAVASTQLEQNDVMGALPLESASSHPLPPLSNPKEDALNRTSSVSEAAAAIAAVAASEGAGGAARGHEGRGEIPYSLYRSLRLDSIRSALGLGESVHSLAHRIVDVGVWYKANAAEEAGHACHAHCSSSNVCMCAIV